MFKHILIPTDGSTLAAKGVRAGVRLAKALGARATGVYVSYPYVPAMYGEAAIYNFMDEKGYRRIAEKQARKALAVVEAEARRQGVRCATRSVNASQPGDAIVKAARAARCDAIAMASHGRGGLGSLLVGSETQRVLARSKVPVLVVR